jgi:hypothetical protein
MATVTQVATSGSFVIYDVEPSAWSTPQVRTFDSRGTLNVALEGMIDVVILGDGYRASDQAAFQNYASHFYDSLMAVWPYNQFQSAFRVRAVFVPSNTLSDAATPDTFYSVGVDSDGIASGVGTTAAYETALYDTLGALNASVVLNTRIFPEELKTGFGEEENFLSGNRRVAFGRGSYSDVCRNLTVVQAVNRASGSRSGYARTVNAPSGHALSGWKVRVGFGEYDVHEFGHAFAYLEDEYIENRGDFDTTLRVDPSHPSVFTLSNISYRYPGTVCPWRHLAWNGQSSRDADSYVAQQWTGGNGFEEGVWHSEYKCLMNGGHQNYHHRTDETRPDAGLRTRDRFCIWCEELVTLRVLEATNALLESGDPVDNASINALGRIWYWRWVDGRRNSYWTEFDLSTRLSDREAWYHDPNNLRVTDSSTGDTIFDGQLNGTNLMKEITERPRPGRWFAPI